LHVWVLVMKSPRCDAVWRGVPEVLPASITLVARAHNLSGSSGSVARGRESPLS
jgi:hypothetical protein